MIEQLIAAGKYEEALMLIKDSKDEVKVYQKILCLYSLKRLNEARLECELLKEYAEKNYYDVIAIYVTILIDFNKHFNSFSLVDSLRRSETYFIEEILYILS